MLSFWQVVSLVVGNLVGSGIFMLPVSLAPYKDIALPSWVLASCGAIALALIFSNLFYKNPKTGGPHVYVEQAFGKHVGFFVAWVYWVLAWIGYAALIISAINYFSIFLNCTLNTSQLLLIEMLLIVFFTIFNILSVSIAGKIELYLTIIKVLPIVIIPIIGIFFGNHIELSKHFSIDFNNSDLFKNIANVILLMFFCFMGLETATVPGEEVVNAKKTIPRATILGTLIAAFIYLIGTFAIFNNFSMQELLQSKAPYADLAFKIVPNKNWYQFISMTATVCCLGALNGWMLVGGRIAYGAAIDGLFPSVFKKLNKKHVPINAMLISSACAIPFLFFSLKESLIAQFNFVVEISVSLVMIIYLLCALAYTKNIIQENNKKIKYWFLAIIASLFCTFILFNIDLSLTLYSLLVFLTGIPIWYKMILRKKNKISLV